MADNDSKRNKETEEIWVHEFNEKAAQDFRDSLIKEIGKGPQAPIVIYIDSYGGNVDGLAKMLDTMDEIPNPKITVCIGKAMSAGAILLSHGNYRFVSKRSRLMIHELSAGYIGKIGEINNSVEELNRLNRLFLNLLASNCNIKGGYTALKKILKEQEGGEIYLDAAAAVKFGIADKVGVPQIIGAQLWQVGVVPEFSTNIKSGGKSLEEKVMEELQGTVDTKTKKKTTKRNKKRG